MEKELTVETAELTKELTAEEQMEIAIKAEKAKQKKIQDARQMELLNDEDYIGFLTSVQQESDDKIKLNSIIELLNAVKPIKSNDGTEYRINCYPVAESIFGSVLSRVFAIIQCSAQMFTDERQLDYKIHTGIDHGLASITADSIGSPAYFSKGILVNAVPGNAKLEYALTLVLTKLGLSLDYMLRLDGALMQKYFDLAEAKAHKQMDEHNKVQQLDSTSKFTLED